MNRTCIYCFMRSILFIIACLPVMITGCKGEKKNAIADSKSIPVKVIRAEKSMIESTVEIFGRFYPENQVSVFSKISGKVLRTYASDGAQVTKGQLLAEIIQEIPGQEYAPYRVTSPIDGTILKRYVDTGMTVNQQTVLFDTGSLQCLIFRGQVFGSDRSKVKTGQVLKLVNRDGANDLSLQISKISPVVDSITGGLTVEAEICFLEERPVFAGQTISGKIIIESGVEVSIPVISLVRLNKEGDGVFVVENGTAAFKKITIIDRNENYCAVTGIQPGDAVITEGSGFVYSGVSVTVIGE